MILPLLDPTKRWECPACGLQHVTRDPRPITPMHTCKALRGLSAPFNPAGAPKTVYRTIEREDFVGSEDVQTDGEGRPISALHRVRPDGSHDTFVFAPTAHLRADAHSPGG